jgi:hypothetical protein
MFSTGTSVLLTTAGHSGKTSIHLKQLSLTKTTLLMGRLQYMKNCKSEKVTDTSSPQNSIDGGISIQEKNVRFSDMIMRRKAIVRDQLSG